MPGGTPNLTVPGLTNLGNTCFFASVLQALASSSLFLDDLVGATGSESPSNVPLTTALKELLVELQARDGPLAAVNPSKLLEELRERIPEDALEEGEQHDAAEAFETLIDAVEEELQAQYRRKETHLASWAHALELTNSNSRRHQRRRPRPLAHCTGHLLEEMCCTSCGTHFTRRIAPFRTLPLPLSTVRLSLSVSKSSSRSSSMKVKLPSTLLRMLSSPPHSAQSGGASRVLKGASVLGSLSTVCQAIELVEGVACPRCSLNATLAGVSLSPGSKLESHPLSRQNSEASSLGCCSGLLEEDAPRRPVHTSTEALQEGMTCGGSGGEVPVEVHHLSFKPLHPQLHCHRTLEVLFSHNISVSLEQPPQPGGGEASDWDGEEEEEEGVESTEDMRSSALEWLFCLKESGVPLADGEMLQRLAEVAGLRWVSRHTRVARSSPIAQAPRVLVLHLKRGLWSSSGQQAKLAGHIRFPLQLDLRQFAVHAVEPAQAVAPESGAGEAGRAAVLSSEGELEYELLAAVVHTGASSNGHYQLFRRLRSSRQQPANDGPDCGDLGPEGSRDSGALVGGSHCDIVGPEDIDLWLSISDTDVHSVEVSAVLSCEATLLLYQRRQRS